MKIVDVITENVRYLNTHREGDAIVIDTFIIPPELRGTRRGSQVYKQWESELDIDIKYVSLVPVDNSDMFWKKMGFEYLYNDSEDPDFDVPSDMVKGVNGYATPKKDFEVDVEE